VLRHNILTFDEVKRSLDVAREASFVDRAPIPGRARDEAGRRPRSAAIALEVEV
jgi:hypothetical protein